MAPAGASAASSTRPCPGIDGFSCTRIDVPLDRTGTVGGTLSLRFATEAGVAPKKKALLALTGGPGQPAVMYGPSYAEGFAEQLDEYSLVVMDQRGTGGSYALSCPEVQAIDTLSTLYPEDVAGCAERIGPKRNSFASIDTADDIEAIRRKLGVEKIAIYGVSYGTWVAQQYARRYPDRVDRLVLDSVVPPGGDPWDTELIRSLPRVLRHLCANERCKGITADPFADLTAIVRRMQQQGKLTGTIRNSDGGRQTVDLSQTDLLYMLIASDLNSFLQSRLPAAMVAARRGDEVPLLRLKRDAAGPISPLKDFSAGLFVSTTCLDKDPPYSYGDSFEVRAEKARAALAALPDDSFAPFDRASIDASSVPQICLHWPDGVFRAESTEPLPDVPTLILAGLTDVRTSLEGAKRFATEVPQAQLVTLGGGGHDLFDTDYTGCVDTAIRRFFADRKVGSPCRGNSIAPKMEQVPPLTLSAVSRVPAVPGARGQVLRAAVGAVTDSAVSDSQAYYAGFDDTGGGGLRGGLYESIATGSGLVLVLRRLEYVRGVRVTGSVLVEGESLDGIIKVTAPDGLSGRLRLAGRRVAGRLGGRAVRTTVGHLSRTSLARPARSARAALRLRLP